MGHIACYVRVSTEDQSFDRQMTTVSDYAQRELDADLADLTVYRDKSTGTNVKRSGYESMFEALGDGEHDVVVTPAVSRVSRSIRDLDRTVERIVDDAGAELHIVSEGMQLIPGEDDPYQKAMLQMLGVFAEMEAELAQMRTKEGIAALMANPEYHHGPAPMGFEKNDGHLVRASNYDQVVATLNMVATHGVSKRQAAKDLDVARATISNALDRAELYGLGSYEVGPGEGRCYCCGRLGKHIDGTLNDHHVSYRGPEIIPVCSSCHNRIHRESEFYDDLVPDVTREEALRLGYITEEGGAGPESREVREAATETTDE